MNKAIIFDASTLISFAMNGLFEEFKALKKVFNGSFIITNEVKNEIIDRPIKIKRFKLEALKLKQLLDEKFLVMPDFLAINGKEISKNSQEILDIANKTFRTVDKYVNIIDSGETSCLALSKILNKKKIKNVIAVDERTIRMLCEKPDNLNKLLQKKLHEKIISKRENYKFFNEFKFIRSAELVYIIWKKELIKLKNSSALDALLYAVKFKGCAISDEEIKEIERLK